MNKKKMNKKELIAILAKMYEREKKGEIVSDIPVLECLLTEIIREEIRTMCEHEKKRKNNLNYIF